MSPRGDRFSMGPIEEPGRSRWRLSGRGREDTTPAFLLFGVLVVVGAVAALVVGLVFLVQALV